MKVLVSGANGLIGTALVRVLKSRGHVVVGAVRQKSSIPVGGLADDYIMVGSIDSSTDWTVALQGVDAVVHLAARVHVMNESEADPLGAFRRVNLYGTKRLAEQSVACGVRRFVYLSSIKVNGEKTDKSSFSADDEPHPADPYAVSKAEAESWLRSLSKDTDMEVMIVRPPLVYGPGVGGNFLRLMKLVERSIPLPLASIKNERSMVSLDNICDFLAHCLEHHKTVENVFLVSDSVDWSTPMLIRSIARHMGVSAPLFPVPPFLLRLAGSISRQSGVINRLCDSLKVDITRTRQLLDWNPPQTPDDGVRRTVDWYMRQRN
jgi:UDP-glucose 4-epimerase